MLPDPFEQPVMTLWPEVAEAFGKKRSAIYEANRRGELPFPTWRIGAQILAPTAMVRRALGLDLEESARKEADRAS